MMAEKKETHKNNVTKNKKGDSFLYVLWHQIAW